MQLKHSLTHNGTSLDMTLLQRSSIVGLGGTESVLDPGKMKIKDIEIFSFCLLDHCYGQGCSIPLALRTLSHDQGLAFDSHNIAKIVRVEARVTSPDRTT